MPIIDKYTINSMAWDSATLEGWHPMPWVRWETLIMTLIAEKILLKMATSKTSNPKSQKTGGTPIQSLAGHSKMTMGRSGHLGSRVSTMQSKAITIMQNWMQLNSSIAFRKRLKLKLARLIH